MAASTRELAGSRGLKNQSLRYHVNTKAKVPEVQIGSNNDDARTMAILRMRLMHNTRDHHSSQDGCGKGDARGRVQHPPSIHAPVWARIASIRLGQSWPNSASRDPNCVSPLLCERTEDLGSTLVLKVLSITSAPLRVTVPLPSFWLCAPLRATVALAPLRVRRPGANHLP